MNNNSIESYMKNYVQKNFSKFVLTLKDRWPSIFATNPTPHASRSFKYGQKSIFDNPVRFNTPID